MADLTPYLIGTEYQISLGGKALQDDPDGTVIKAGTKDAFQTTMYKVSWNAQTADKIGALRTILLDSIKGKPLAWTPPHGDKGAYRVGNYSETCHSASNYSATVELTLLRGVKIPT